MRAFIANVLSDSTCLDKEIEICGKVVNVDITNKSCIIKVDDGSGLCRCFIWTTEYKPLHLDYLGKSVIIVGRKSMFFQEVIINISEIIILSSIYDELQWRLSLMAKKPILDQGR